MWCNDPSFDKIITDANGDKWSFRVLKDIKGAKQIQQIYFWNNDKTVTGKVDFINDQVLHFRRLKDRLIKLAKEKEYRDKFLCD